MPGLFNVRLLKVATPSTAVAVSGCATVTRGTHTSFVVESQPQGAAVRTSSGYTCPATPCTFKMERKHSFDVTVTLAGRPPGRIASAVARVPELIGFHIGR